MREEAATQAMRAQSATASSMEPLLLSRLPPDEAVLAFCELFSAELDYRSTHGLPVQDLRRYYRNLFLADGRPDPLGVYGYGCRLAPVLLSLREKPAARLLDAGCGYGTESLLLALLGADVTGVDLVPERVELAQSRPSFYENRTAATLSVRFVNADLLRYLEAPRPFDIIWAMEAVSHIHPLETFLALAQQRLSPGGLLIASDPNALNPVSFFRAYRIRGTLQHRLRAKGRDPDSGAAVQEAVEWIFSVLGYVRKLRQAGFGVRQITMSGFMASSLLPRRLHTDRLVFALLTSLHRALQACPLWRLMGANYTVVAQKLAHEQGRVDE